MPLDHEEELIRRVKQDPQAFAFVYDQHYHSIFSYVFRRLANYEAARDVTAETFLKGFQKIDAFEWRSIPISAWLFRIATNEINLFFRQAKYRPACLDTNLHRYLRYEEGVETEKAALEQALKESNDFLMIQKQLLDLDTKYQEVIALRFFEEKSMKEISAILGKKEGTIKSLLSRGLKKLRMALEQERLSLGEGLG